MSLFKKFLITAALAFIVALPLSASAQTVADWHFNEDNATGSIADNTLVITDQSGNGNNLKMRKYGTNFASTASFSDESLSGNGSIFLNGNHTDGGIDFITAVGAPINTNNFANGYTIEIVYKMPEDWAQGTDKWTSLIARLAPSDKNVYIENEKVSMTINVSNCKEIQAQIRDKDGENPGGDVWSVAMDKGETWYHIVVTGDSSGVRTFINGCESFRDKDVTYMQGLYADSADGRFRIGSKLNEYDILSKYTRGYIERIRISDKALSKSEWIIPNPEAIIGEYGSNASFAETPEGRYNMVFVPDTQNATKFCGPVLDKAVEWLVGNKDYANIKAVVSLGDNVENRDDTAQWEQISKTYKAIANGGIKTIVPTGNHDTSDGYDYSYYNNYFGPTSSFASLVKDYTLAYSPSGAGAVVDVSAGSYDYKLIYLDMYKLETAWLTTTLEQYAASPVIIVLHDIQNCSDTIPNETQLSPNGKILWETVKEYDNVFMMVGGHSHGYGVLELTNNFGNSVYSILADYQFSYNGGNALMKFAEFDEEGNKIRVSTFSPYVATLAENEKSFFDVNYMTGKGNYDELDINFKERFSSFKTYRTVGKNIMSNPSFEDEKGNFSLEGWLSASTNAQFGSPYTTNHCYAVNSTERIFNGVTTKAETTIPDGKWAFATNWHDGTDGLCSLKRYVPVEAGKTYTVSYKVKHKYGENGGYIITSLVANEGAAENSSTATNAGFIGTEWTTVTRTFTATEDTDHILFWFRWLGEGGNPGNGPYWYFDDFSVVEVEEEYLPYIKNLKAVKTDNTVTVSFERSKNDNAKFIVAGYGNDDNLIQIVATEENKAELTDPDITSVKLFCWRGLTNVLPLTKSLDVTIK